MAGGRKVGSKSGSGSGGSGGSSQSQAGPESSSHGTPCAVCSRIIVESTSSCRGDEALQCEGCHHWFHRWCTGISTHHYSALSVSTDSFLCFVCLHKEMRTVVGSLKDTIGALQSEITALNAKCSRLDSITNSSVSNSEASSSPAAVSVSLSSDSTCPNHVHTPIAASSDSRHHAYSSSDERKFNLLIFGVKEHDKGTPRHLRLSRDHSSAGSILSSVDESVSCDSFRDCFRLGKFHPDHSRPLLVKLVRSHDVALVLKNRKRIVSSHVYIKPDLSPQQCKVESLLLKERRSLINSGVARNIIFIRGNTLFVNNSCYGTVKDGVFLKSSAFSPQSIPSSCNHASADSLSGLPGSISTSEVRVSPPSDDTGTDASA